MKLSYAITVKDEIKQIQKLTNFLLEHKRAEDEIVVLYDNLNGSKEVEDYLRTQNITVSEFKWHNYPFDGHFDRFKNHLTELCSGDYIINIDADELPTKTFMENIPTVLVENDVDMIMVPRVNTVEGLTSRHIKRWGWNVNKKGWVNWPDAQQRIYKNNGTIRWTGKVHERLEGYKTVTNLPINEEWALQHPKDIKRQEKQNNYYDTL